MQYMPLSSQSGTQVQQLALMHALGNVEAQYKTKDERVSAFAGILWMLYMLVLVSVLFFTVLSSAGNQPWLWFAALFFASMILLGLWAFVSMFTTPRITVVVCKEGLIHIKNGMPEVVRWDQVEHFWKNISIGSDSDSYHYTIERKDGVQIVIPDALKGRVEVGALIESRVTPRLLAPIQSMYQSGFSVAFGEITLTTQEMSVENGRKALAWSAVGGIELTDESIDIYQQGIERSWYHQAVARIPDVAVLKILVERTLQDFADRQLPSIISSYNAGMPLTFGRLSLDQRGVTIDNGKKFLPWQEVRDITVNEHEKNGICITTYSKLFNWETLSTRTTPNVVVLQKLVAYILRQHRQQINLHVQNALPQTIASYNAGMPVSFGRVSFSLQGIAVDGGRQFLSWSEISQFSISMYYGGERLSISKKGKHLLTWQALRTSELGDVALLKEFLDYLKNTHP